MLFKKFISKKKKLSSAVPLSAALLSCVLATPGRAMYSDDDASSSGSNSATLRVSESFYITDAVKNPNATSVKELDLCFRNPTIQKVVLLLQAYPSLRGLTLNFQEAGDYTVGAHVARYLDTNPGLRSLTVKNGLDNTFKDKLLENLRTKGSLCFLNLSSGLTNEDSTSIFQALRSNPNARIVTLNLSSNRIGGGKKPEIMKRLLGESSAPAIRNFIHYNHTLSDLNLSNNSLNDGDAQNIVEVVKHNGTLTNLDLQRNYITPQIIEPVIKEVRTHQYLTKPIGYGRQRPTSISVENPKD